MKLHIFILCALLTVLIGCEEQAAKTDNAVVTEKPIRTEPIVLSDEGAIVISKGLDDALTMRNLLNYPVTVRCEYTVIEYSPRSADKHYIKTRWLKSISSLESTNISSLVFGDIITVAINNKPISIFIVSF